MSDKYIVADILVILPSSTPDKYILKALRLIRTRVAPYIYIIVTIDLLIS